MTTEPTPTIETITEERPDVFATYCPEDNKLRLYCGWVERPIYERLRAEGWQATPKQDCQFSAVWTPSRYATAIELCGIVLDEDQSPEDRAADRAERFGGYRDKRLDEATGHADRYDAGPTAHGYQSQARAERSARRHDRIGYRAADCWSRADYWTHRTAGVIRNALHKSTPGVRMGRIKELEAELRKREKDLSDYARTYAHWQAIEDEPDREKQTTMAREIANYDHDGEYTHPVSGEKTCSLWRLLTPHEVDGEPISGAVAARLWLDAHPAPKDPSESAWICHLRLRLAYENQMLEAQGGRAAFVEMEVGGWLGSHQIRKVNKSSATGRVVSVTLKMPGTRWDGSAPGFCFIPYNVERLPAGAYRPPSEEDKAALAEEKKGEKAAAPVVDCPLINPTDEDAERLQLIFNEAHPRGEAQQVLRMSQAKYSAYSKGEHSPCGTLTLSEHGTECLTDSMGEPRYRHKVCKVRTGPSAGGSFRSAPRVVIITDKPQKPLPFVKMDKLRAQEPSTEKMRDKLPAIERELCKSWLSEMDKQLIKDAVYVGWVSVASMSQVGWTPAGHAALAAYKATAGTKATQLELV
jgi:hypothetical protein